MEDKVVITQGKYIASAVRRDQYPSVALPEIAFMGRSNVGKSSLINSLTRIRNMAHVSGQPGKTQTINFYELGAKLPGEIERRSFYLVDLPGYGYAKSAKKNRSIWAKFIEEYLLASTQLLFVCQLIDSRHELMDIDRKMFLWLVGHNVPVLPIATKTDKLSRSAATRQIAGLKRALGAEDVDILPYSSVTNAGRDELLATIGDAISQ